MKKKLFSVTASDCRFDYFRGPGKGGQKRNKTSNAVRCTHKASGAVGVATDTRSQTQNKRLAFERMANSDVFKQWHRIEVARRTGAAARAEEEVDKAMRNVRVETKDSNGRWVVG
ncbi:MAG: peptide chain release factor family protein [Candidatus Thorarchaeota archaeon]|jgi:protein subunit release factor B